jgi:cytochrome c-type biogenesis protein CcmE
MTHRYIKVGATAFVLIAAFGLMMWSTLREGTEYYKNVDEVMVHQQDWHGKQLQLHGYVVPDSILVKKSTLEYKFKVQNNPTRSPQPGTIVEVTYKGIVPDTFKDEAEVVLKGKLSPTGFHTDPGGVMAKCPSKYEAQEKSVSAGS